MEKLIYALALTLLAITQNSSAMFKVRDSLGTQYETVCERGDMGKALQIAQQMIAEGELKITREFLEETYGWGRDEVADSLLTVYGTELIQQKDGIEATKEWLKRGSTLTQEQKDVMLFCSVGDGKLELVKRCLAMGANPNTVIEGYIAANKRRIALGVDYFKVGSLSTLDFAKGLPMTGIEIIEALVDANSKIAFITNMRSYMHDQEQKYLEKVSAYEKIQKVYDPEEKEVALMRLFSEETWKFDSDVDRRFFDYLGQQKETDGLQEFYDFISVAYYHNEVDQYCFEYILRQYFTYVLNRGIVEQLENIYYGIHANKYNHKEILSKHDIAGFEEWVLKQVSDLKNPLLLAHYIKQGWIRGLEMNPKLLVDNIHIEECSTALKINHFQQHLLAWEKWSDSEKFKEEQNGFWLKVCRLVHDDPTIANIKYRWPDEDDCLENFDLSEVAILAGWCDLLETIYQYYPEKLMPSKKIGYANPDFYPHLGIAVEKYDWNHKITKMMLQIILKPRKLIR